MERKLGKSEELTESLHTMVEIMKEDPLVWTTPWPDLPLDVLRCMRSREWMDKLKDWPDQSRTDGDSVLSHR